MKPETFLLVMSALFVGAASLVPVVHRLLVRYG